MKVCKKCGLEKSLSEYSQKNAKGRKPGLQCRCKSCCVQDTREWYQANRARAKDTRLRKLYGFGLDEYNARLLAQDNSCLLCGIEFSSGSFGPDSPVVDHCHNDGHVRGILCNECNRGLGYFHDNKEALMNAVSYLSNEDLILVTGVARAIHN